MKTPFLAASIAPTFDDRPSPDNRITLPPIWFTLAIAVAMVALAWPCETLDMQVWLVPWFGHIQSSGPVGAFATPFSNYTPPFLYLLALVSPLAAIIPVVSLIKLVALLTTGALVLAVHRLLTAFSAQTPWRGALLVAALPSVAINAGLMGQCDSLWSATAIMAVAMAGERRHAAMLAWCGIAFAIKAQAILIAPFILAVLLSRSVPLRLWPIAPFATALVMLPAIAAGWPPADIAMIYARQADTFPMLSMNAPNIWSVVQAMPYAGFWPIGGLGVVAAIGATAWYVARFGSRPLDGHKMIGIALLSPLLVAGLLPRMHERYFFVADILALTWFLLRRDRSSLALAALVQAGSLGALFAFASEIITPAAIGALAMILATDRLVRHLLQRPANDNPLVPRGVRLAI